MTEMLDVIDEEEKVIDTLTREFIIKHNLLHLGIWLIVKNSKGQILIHRRSDRKPQTPGKWDIKISGLVQSGETPEKTCVREAEEEFGIVVNPEFLGKHLYRSESYQDVSYMYKAVYDGDLKPNQEEVASYEWVTLPDLDRIIKEREFIGTSYFVLQNCREILWQKW